jgi:NitT/TauT family transport system substrate-binding protein
MVLVLAVSACSEQQSQDSFRATTTIAVSATPLSAPVFIAAEKGYFNKYGLDITLKKYNGGHRCLQAVLNGDAEFATSSDYPIMLNAFDRNDYEVLATFVSSVNDVKLMTKKSVISKTAGLKSRTIGVVKGGSSHYFLDRFLIFNSLNLDEVVVQHVSPEKMPAALQNGKVDAIAVWEPFGYIAHTKLGSELNIFPAQNAYRETFNLVSLKQGKQGKQEKNEITIRLLKALRESINYIYDSPAQAQQVLMKELNLDEEFIDWIWSDFDFRLSLDQTFLLTLENESRWAVENNIINKKQPSNYLDYINVVPLTAVEPSLVSIVK